MSVTLDQFGASDAEPVIVEGDALLLKIWRDFVPISQRVLLRQTLLCETPWHETELQLYGRRVKMPRLTCWYGEPEAVYSYSGIKNEPLPWTDCLGALRRKVQSVTGAEFNSVLMNLYRDGKDHVSWHSDAEQELGVAPVIASISLGVSRRFDLRRARAQERPFHATRSIELTDGMLLLMAGNTQRSWQHSIAKAPRITEPRINLTFRRVFSRATQAGALRG